MIWLALLACRGRIECDRDEPCPFGGSCEDGACVYRACATSQQCPLEHHCSPDGECLVGCASATDCRAGEACEGGACVEPPCTSTKVDCAFREVCVDGRCVDAGEPYCQPCTTDEECGPGNVCWADEWCGVDCSDGSACPAAFECLEVTEDGADHELCLGACWLE